MNRLLFLGGASVVVLVSAAAVAQEEGSTSISIGEIGSTRIGGPGATDEERRREAYYNAPDEYLTEEALVPPGHRKRQPQLIELATRYIRSQSWNAACTKIDTLRDEFPDEPFAEAKDPDELKQSAARAYFQCAELAYGKLQPEKAETLLQKSEQIGPSDYRHESLRRKMLRDRMHSKMSKGDVTGAVSDFRKYQAELEDPDERIWVGEELAKLAWSAYRDKDELRMREYMTLLEDVAPRNTEYRKLKKKIESDEGILTRVVTFAAVGAGLVAILTLLSQWRSRARVKFKRNPYDLDDDV